MITDDVVCAARGTQMINAILQFLNLQTLYPDLMAEILAHFPEFIAQVASDAAKVNESRTSSGNPPSNQADRPRPVGETTGQGK
jgi:hypothetical protein